MSKNLHKIFFLFLAAAMVGTVFLCSQFNSESTGWPTAEASGRSDLGEVGFVSSLPRRADKDTAISKIEEAGFSWDKEEFTYSDDMSYVPYDAAYGKLRSAGVGILGLLTYPGPDRSHAQWKDYVEEVTDRYPAVGAWEIMNEADNYLSAADYTVYLKEAYDIIKGKGGDTVIMSGLTARWEVYPYWDGVAAAGGWGSFDAVGLHMYHDGPPGEDSYNNGTLSQEVQQVVDSIGKNGGGKSIWVTEYGYDSNTYGLENQANWLVEGLGIISGFGQVERIFIFRLFDRDNATGLITSSFVDKPAYGAVKNWINGSAPEAVVAEVPEPAPVAEPVAEPVPEPEPEPVAQPVAEPALETKPAETPAPETEKPAVTAPKAPSPVVYQPITAGAQSKSSYPILIYMTGGIAIFALFSFLIVNRVKGPRLLTK